MWDYNDKVYEYFRNPRNMGDLSDANAIGQVGSIACGDVMRLALKIDPETEVIREAKFKTFGCASAIASASILTELVIGKSLQDAENISNDDIVTALGGLPASKMHCSVMGHDALVAALNDYRGIETTDDTHEDEGTIVCTCFGVTDAHIERVVRDNDLTTIEDVTNYTKAGGACQSCHMKIQDIIDAVNAENKE